MALLLAARRGEDAVMTLVSDGQRALARKLFFLAGILGGLRTDFQRFPAPLPRVFLIVSNHQSLADIPAVTVCFPRHPVRFVAKRELRRGIPYISRSLRFGRSALVSRTRDFGEGQRGAAEARRALAGGDLSHDLSRGHPLEDGPGPGVLHGARQGDPGALPDARAVRGRGRRAIHRHDRAGAPAPARRDLPGETAHPLPRAPRKEGDHGAAWGS